MMIYIVDPMTGMPQLNYPAFFEAAKQLRSAGYEVESPAENSAPPGGDWRDCMRMALVQIARADAMALLPGWSASRGARIEERLGRDLCLDVRPVDTWLG